MHCPEDRGAVHPSFRKLLVEALRQLVRCRKRRLVNFLTKKFQMIVTEHFASAGTLRGLQRFPLPKLPGDFFHGGHGNGEPLGNQRMTLVGELHSSGNSLAKIYG